MNNTEVYHNLLEDILQNGIRKENRTGVDTTSVFGRMLKFNLKEGFPLLTTKRLHVKSIIHELIWFLSGDTNIRYLQENGVSIWDEWADENGDLGPVYGKQWVNWEGLLVKKAESGVDQFAVSTNQIQVAIDRLKTNPDCRRIIVSAWNVTDLPKMKLMPCHYGFQLWTRELSLEERIANARKISSIPLPSHLINQEWIDLNFPSPTRAISMYWTQRSVDTFLGLPFNIASYALLLHMFAQQVNMIPDELTAFLGDTHLYENHIEYVKKQLERNPKEKPQPQLHLNQANDIFGYRFDDFAIVNYDPFPNWKGVPIAI